MWDIGKVILAGLVRYALVALSTWLIARGILTPEQDFSQNAALVGEIVGYLILTATAAHMAWTRIKEKRLSNTKGAMGQGTTDNDAKKLIDTGQWASALTPAHVAPIIEDNSKESK